MILVPVILSGGAGTRLWPLSRELYPKQLLALTGERTMLQDTVRRTAGAGAGAPVIVCNDTHRFLVAEQLRGAGVEPRAIVLEPAGRNTAPAVAIAALAALEGGDDPVLLVSPADHVVRDPAPFDAAVALGARAAAEGKLVTFGVVPDRPETGYGYIRHEAGDGTDEAPPWAVERFVEKPDAARAREFLDDGGYLWNSGIFMFRAGRYLEELERFAPAIHAACRRAHAGARRDLDFTRIDAEAFAACPSDSIDYAVMEKTADAVVVPLDAGWSDVGSWDSLRGALPADERGNVVRGDVIACDTDDSYVHATSRLVATVGVRDMVVVETADAVLVAPRDRVQDVRDAVARLHESGRQEPLLHRQVFRPWGSYDSVDQGDRFQVKRLVVNPGATLSLQMHHHRAEHWIVVSGTARITRDDEVFVLTENQSTYIPIGARHRIENPGTIPLHIIEVQSGSYLGEDDIVRFDDEYGRVEN